MRQKQGFLLSFIFYAMIFKEKKQKGDPLHPIQNTLIVLNYNDADTTIRFLDMALSCPTIDRIVAVDNYSNDGSFEKLQAYASDRVHVIRTERNGGYGYGNNFGCRHAIQEFSPEVLFLANPDTAFEDTVIRRIQDLLSDPVESKVALAAPLVNQGYNAWYLPDYRGVLRSIFLLLFHREKKALKQDLLDHNSSPYVCVGVTEGSFFGIRRSIYQEICGLDERTFLYYEENILAKKLDQAGYHVAILPDIRYDHFHSISIKKQYGTKAKAFLQFHPSMLLYLKEYLHINIFQRILFEICFMLGFGERILYDLVGGRKVTERI